MIVDLKYNKEGSIDVLLGDTDKKVISVSQASLIMVASIYAIDTHENVTVQFTGLRVDCTQHGDIRFTWSDGKTMLILVEMIEALLYNK